jgi:hypothetical protein
MLAPGLSLDTLRTDWYATLHYPPELKARIAIAVQAWKDFVVLPAGSRRQFGYLEDTGNSGSGYEFPNASKKDYKHVFHAKLKDRAWLLEEARRVGRGEARTLVLASLEAIERLVPFIADFAERLEREFDVGQFREDFLSDQGESILRHLFYPPGARALGEEIAVQHVDKGGFTLHCWESHGGVERYTNNREWVPFPVHSGEAVVFGSLRLQHRTKNEVKGICHRVVALPETLSHGRWSTVFFSNFKNSPYYDKKRLGPTQGQEPGFNYDIPWEEFQKFFADYDAYK